MATNSIATLVPRLCRANQSGPRTRTASPSSERACSFLANIYIGAEHGGRCPHKFTSLGTREEGKKSRIWAAAPLRLWLSHVDFLVPIFRPFYPGSWFAFGRRGGERMRPISPSSSGRQTKMGGRGFAPLRQEKEDEEGNFMAAPSAPPVRQADFHY